MNGKFVTCPSRVKMIISDRVSEIQERALLICEAFIKQPLAASGNTKGV
jgi:hypothetical protein